MQRRTWSSSSGPFSYGVAASFVAKNRRHEPREHVFNFSFEDAVMKLRHGRLRAESGQDAFFVSRFGDTGGVALGVADGVGGWIESGVDPADFSHAFCAHMAAAADSYRRPAAGASPDAAPAADGLGARELMQRGYDAVSRDSSVPAGGSTATVALLKRDGRLEVANLGDSGFMHLRPCAVHAFSAPQTHGFNTPFQLSVVPRSAARRMAAFGGAQLSDLPRDAEVSRHALAHGDVVVLASDGLWDNLFNQDILRIVSRVMVGAGAWRPGAGGGGGDGGGTGGIVADRHLSRLTDAGGGAEARRPPSTLQAVIASDITAAAKAAALNSKVDGPFAKELKRHYPLERWHGGKNDDICVVVAVVLEDGPVSARL